MEKPVDKKLYITGGCGALYNGASLMEIFFPSACTSGIRV